jgi:hypothetical protein
MTCLNCIHCTKKPTPNGTDERYCVHLDGYLKDNNSCQSHTPETEDAENR